MIMLLRHNAYISLFIGKNMVVDDCPKCHGTRIVREKSGTVHTCFDCLQNGKIDQHDKNIKSAEELRIKL